jgi:hypothetical protein
MRTAALLALVVATLACGSDPAPAPDAAPCGGACGAGTVCSEGRCVAEDAGADAAPEVGEDAGDDAGDDAPGIDAPADEAPPPDALAETGADAPGPDGCGDTSSDPNNCGMCGRRCSFPNAAASCVGGLCGIASCAQGRADCDGENRNGCETDLGERANCGVCGNGCPSAGRCVGGRCEGACPAVPGVTWCFGSCVNTTNDPQNCGACRRRCSAGQLCNGGACCAPARADCDGNAANGCETPIGNAENCARCGDRCGGFCEAISDGTMIVAHRCR